MDIIRGLRNSDEPSPREVKDSWRVTNDYGFEHYDPDNALHCAVMDFGAKRNDLVSSGFTKEQAIGIIHTMTDEFDKWINFNPSSRQLPYDLSELYDLLYERRELYSKLRDIEDRFR